MDFATLKTRLQAQIGRAPSDLCYEMTTADINDGLKLASMQATVSFDVVEAYTLPDDFLEVVSAYYEEGGYRHELKAAEPATFDAQWENGGTPRVYSISDTEMRINGSRSGTINLRYQQKIADLSADTDTNPILENHPAVYVYGVLAHHAALIRNTEALTVHFPAFERAIGQAKLRDRSRRTGGLISPPIPRMTP